MSDRLHKYHYSFQGRSLDTIKGSAFGSMEQPAVMIDLGNICAITPSTFTIYRSKYLSLIHGQNLVLYIPPVHHSVDL